jgi:hypothetical protein
MKKRGFSLIYVVILTVPVTMLAINLLDLTLTDMKASLNTVNLQQAYYFSETGIENAANKIINLNYPNEFNETYYILFNEDTLTYSNSSSLSPTFVKVKITYKRRNGISKYTITSIGSCNGSQYTLTKTITSEQ